MNLHLWSILLFAVGQLADYLSTRYGLSTGRAIEGNPLVRDLGLWQAKIIGQVVFTYLQYQVKGPEALVMGIAFCLYFLGVALHNVWVVW